MASEDMTVKDALWRIVEMASRSSDPRWRGDRTQAMHDLEAAISEIGTRWNDCATRADEARVAAEEAGAQARAARGERDRERARATHWEAKATEALEALAACQAQIETAAEDRQDDLRALRRAHQELSVVRAALAGVEAERDEARSALAAAQTALAAARTAQATARAETEEAEAGRLAAQRAQRLAEAERDAAVGVLERRPAAPDVEIDLRAADDDTGSEEGVDIGPEAEGPERRPTPAKPRLLNVAATLGHLLPDDMDALLVPGARVVRREGRLAALVAVTRSSSPWTEAGGALEERQADMLRNHGFRVEWLEGDRLAS
jgi:hypothetical protein